jgi:hypothetical protein
MESRENINIRRRLYNASIAVTGDTGIMSAL